MRNINYLFLITVAFGIPLGGCTGSSTTLPTDSIGGNVTGLPESSSVVLEDNGGDNLTIGADGAFTFATALSPGASYAVTVLTQPSGTLCQVTDGSGTLAPNRSVLANPTVGSRNVTNVVVACVPAGSFGVGGSVTGLLPGNSVVLTDNGGNGLTVAANTSFTFSAPVAGGSAYAVAVGTQPLGQTCAVTGGSGIVAGNVTHVAVACSDNTYNVSAVVSGLLQGREVVLQDNGADTLTVISNSATSFNVPVASGSPYAVTILTQPTGETCALSGGTGSGNVAGSNVAVTIACTPQSFTVGGTVAGLLPGNLVVLEDNGGNSTTVTANTAFAFSTPISSGSAYAVTAQSPAGQNCAVSNGTGNIGGQNITTVSVSCSDNSYNVGGTISGLTGTLVLQDNGSSTLSTAANGSFSFNTPIASGSTYAASILTQPAGQTCTLDGGSGTVAAAAITSITVTCAANAVNTAGFIWEGGPDTTGAAGVYGTKGTAAPANVPTSRGAPARWTDAAGNFWLFGGTASIAQGDITHYLNDLWKYTPSTGEWTWVSGSNTVESTSVFGTQGVAAPGNMPGSRVPAASWVDANGNLWLFGGFGCDASSCNAPAQLNDLWEFSPASGQWTWMGGSQSYAAAGVYGTLGQPASGNFPGARGGSASWTDLAGNLWLLGGFAYDVNGFASNLNDLWKFSPTTQQWSWIGGSDSVNGALDAVRGTQGQAAAGNWPGAIIDASSTVDLAGNFWLFGGEETLSNGQGVANDMWEYSPGTGLWTCWTSGTGLTNQVGSYGTLGVATGSAFPGGRLDSAIWAAAGNLWVYGGEGTESSTKGFGDLWEFSPGSGLWTWIGGSSSPDNPSPSYGTLGTPSPSNSPGSRVATAFWQDSTGNFWFFGGGNNDGSDASDSVLYSDLWEITP